MRFIQTTKIEIFFKIYFIFDRLLIGLNENMNESVSR